ncbi:hypothetical protein TraAM80_03262 [Trypanosoma rangeli]|uniref:Uncharacterized protein n=1 Tax=Trypanosoma rangeli TaxID=5698 RepID=A0A422NQA5_TRYRA|nr:uncharacterized protein TraAM80_03262 [Trypanosoma rangeli]RNF07579.1 hypothetical protein TraAM80_03262 [Trypanosoma rangeli]|eukprot:RNF07579.1 hypothetical protein TraAM80_03262 [Trypanosoma rangeli]
MTRGTKPNLSVAPTADSGYLLLVECHSGSGGEAFQLGAELLRWPEEVAASVYGGGSATLPSIPVSNKYFSASVRVVITDSDALMAATAAEVADAADASLVSRLMQPPSVQKTGCVLLVDGSVHPDQVSWHHVPHLCLFRVVMNFRGAGAKVRDEMWYDACVANGFEYVPHAEGFEVLPAGVERSGLLGGDHRGAARLCQILHNTMWPESCRVFNETCSDADRHVVRRRAASTNLLAVIGVNGEDVLHWLCTACRDRRFFTAQWPLGAEAKTREQRETSSWRSSEEGEQKVLKLANKYYTATVGVQCLHPALFCPAMVDLFLAQYLDRRPKLAIVPWPPTLPGRAGKGTTFPQLPVLIEHLRLWGVDDCVLLARSAGESLSPFEMHYIEEQGIEVVCVADSELARDEEKAREFGTSGADRLAEIIHTIEWPQRTPAPSSPPTTSLLTSGKPSNRVLLWACAPSTQEEEELLCTTLQRCFPVTSGPNSVALLSLTSSSIDAPLTTVNVCNRYFDATVNVHSFGGARSAVMRETELTAEQLNTFGVVALLTKAEMSDASTCISVQAALEKCCGAQRSRRSICNPECLLLDDEQHGRDITPQLCAAAEAAPVHVWYVVDGDEANDPLATRVDDMLLHAALTTRDTALAEATGDVSRVCKDGSGGSSKTSDDVSSDTEEDFLAAMPIEVLYGVGEVDGVTRLREIVQQHVWPLRTMTTKVPQQEAQQAKDETETRHYTGRLSVEEKEECKVEDAVLAALVVGCELPPDYLVDPLTQKSVHVEALTVAGDGTLGGREQCPLQQKQQELEQELMVWMDKMRRHGHALPRAVRQRQAELLATKLGDHLGKLGEA